MFSAYICRLRFRSRMEIAYQSPIVTGLCRDGKAFESQCNGVRRLVPLSATPARTHAGGNGTKAAHLTRWVRPARLSVNLPGLGCGPPFLDRLLLPLKSPLNIPQEGWITEPLGVLIGQGFDFLDDPFHHEAPRSA